MRVITDPVVDTFSFAVKTVALPAIFRFSCAVATLVLYVVGKQHLSDRISRVAFKVRETKPNSFLILLLI